MPILNLFAALMLMAGALGGVYSDELFEQAESGGAEAQNELGIGYENGGGVEADPEEALRWYTM